MSLTPITTGVRVRKRSGYEFDSIVVAVFEKLDGEVRLVCESTIIPGLLHIFSLEQMVPDRRRRSDDTPG